MLSCFSVSPSYRVLPGFVFMLAKKWLNDRSARTVDCLHRKQLVSSLSVAKLYKTRRNVYRPEGAKRLQALRRLKGWSQRDMASEFGVSPSAVARWESGTRELQGVALKLLSIYELKEQSGRRTDV